MPFGAGAAIAQRGMQRVRVAACTLARVSPLLSLLPLFSSLPPPPLPRARPNASVPVPAPSKRDPSESSAATPSRFESHSSSRVVVENVVQPETVVQPRTTGDAPRRMGSSARKPRHFHNVAWPRTAIVQPEIGVLSLGRSCN